MHNAVGIRFETCGKIYGFKADGLELKKGELVVVESELGTGIGRVVSEDYAIDDPDRELKPVLRRATEEDLRQEHENNALRLDARAYCIERITARGLPMKLVGTDATLDRRRIIFYFVADTRIDFRELVKDLAAKFRTRIELRQIGVRDAAKIVGGIGVCGRCLCCGSFLTTFAPISIKMAKQQELVLNTGKISGLCGRLMCCLSFESDKGPSYEENAEEVLTEEGQTPEHLAVSEPAPVSEPDNQQPPAAVEKPPALETKADAPARSPSKKPFHKPKKRQWRRPKKK